MTVCRFYLQGNCKFGNNCRFEHSQPGRGGYSSGYNDLRSKISGQERTYQPQENHYNNRDYYSRDSSRDYSSSNYRGGRNGDYRDNRDYSHRSNNRFATLADTEHAPSSSHTSDNTDHVTPQEVMLSMRSDIEEWEASASMWKYSCYAFAKDVQVMPGLEDLSPEEMRYKAYEAQASGDTSTFVQWYSQLEKEYEQRKQEYKYPSVHIKPKLYDIIDTLLKAARNKLRNSTSSSVGVFGSSTTPGSSVFGGSSATNSSSNLFGNSTQQSTSLFGGNNPASGDDSTLMSFDQGTPATPQILFGKPVTSSNQTSTPRQQLFQSSPPTQQNNTLLFQNSNSGIFGSPPQSNSNNSATTQSLFGGAHSNQSLFGNSNNNQSLFGNTTVSQSPFGNTSAQSLFGGGGVTSVTQQTYFQSNTSNSFNADSAAASSNASRSTKPAACIYTPIDQLTDEEKTAFQAAKFELGKVPTRPPPRELV